MGVLDVDVTVKTRGGLWWARLMRLIAPVVGEQRALDWAVRGYWRLARWRINRGAWQRFEKGDRP